LCVAICVFQLAVKRKSATTSHEIALAAQMSNLEPDPADDLKQSMLLLRSVKDSVERENAADLIESKKSDSGTRAVLQAAITARENLQKAEQAVRSSTTKIARLVTQIQALGPLGEIPDHNETLASATENQSKAIEASRRSKQQLDQCTRLSQRSQETGNCPTCGQLWAARCEELAQQVTDAARAFEEDTKTQHTANMIVTHLMLTALIAQREQAETEDTAAQEVKRNAHTLVLAANAAVDRINTQQEIVEELRAKSSAHKEHTARLKSASDKSLHLALTQLEQDAAVLTDEANRNVMTAVEKAQSEHQLNIQDWQLEEQRRTDAHAKAVDKLRITMITEGALEKKIDDLVKQLDKLTDRRDNNNPHAQLCEFLKNSRERLHAQCQEARVTSTDLQRTSLAQTRALTWVGRKAHGIQAYLAEQAAHTLATEVTHWAQKLFGDDTASFNVQYKENGELHRICNIGESVGAVSGGQMQLMELAGFMAFRQVWQQRNLSINILVLDEPFLGLDKGSALRLLHTMSGATRFDKFTCFLVSHDSSSNELPPTIDQALIIERYEHRSVLCNQRAETASFMAPASSLSNNASETELDADIDLEVCAVVIPAKKTRGGGKRPLSAADRRPNKKSKATNA
jgi:hypothetical protein